LQFGSLEGIFGGVGFVEHRHLFLLRDVDRLSAVGEQLVGAVRRSVGRRILAVVFGLAVPPDVFMCVVTGPREDVLPCIHARHPAGRHADGQLETPGPQHCAPPSPRAMGIAAGADGASAVASTVTHAPPVASDKLSDASRDVAVKLRLGDAPTPRSWVARMTKRPGTGRCGQERLPRWRPE
jgi:hypothetical protein